MAATATGSNDEKTGPNDASGVVWALGEYFFFLRFFLILTKAFVTYIVSNDEMRAAMTKTGPNDARCVVWALGEYILFSSLYLILTNVFIAYIISNDEIRA
jgi:hypothetical protein